MDTGESTPMLVYTSLLRVVSFSNCICRCQMLEIEICETINSLLHLYSTPEKCFQLLKKKKKSFLNLFWVFCLFLGILDFVFVFVFSNAWSQLCMVLVSHISEWKEKKGK